jgi:tRNA A37 threonylcarbamoyladenosine dehydratase
MKNGGFSSVLSRGCFAVRKHSKAPKKRLNLRGTDVVWENIHPDAFLRNRMLLGDAAMEKLAAAHVAVLGLGGVGGYAAEALTRAGVGALTLADHDTVGAANINRQMCALHSTLGLPKAEAVRGRLIDINPAVRARPLVLRYTADSRETFFDMPYDYVIDAIDIVTCKLDLIETALTRGIPIVSSLGTGNKLEPEALRISDIGKTQMCPLARVMRKELRRRGIRRHMVLWSTEDPIGPEPLEEPPEGRRSVPASIPWVPACAGFMLGGFVVRRLIGDVSKYSL